MKLDPAKRPFSLGALGFMTFSDWDSPRGRPLLQDIMGLEVEGRSCDLEPSDGYKWQPDVATMRGRCGDALAPPDGWDGPYRVRRPTGPVGPRELVVGLAPKNDHEHMPFRRALEAQYRTTAADSERTVAQRRLEDDMKSTTKLHYSRPETRSINPSLLRS